jgi:hypothetical protein
MELVVMIIVCKDESFQAHIGTWNSTLKERQVQTKAACEAHLLSSNVDKDMSPAAAA